MNPMKCALMAGLSALLLSMAACSKADEELASVAPEAPKDTTVVTPVDNNDDLTPGTDARPTWQAASDLYQRYEQTMTAQVTVQKELLPYVSADDLLCVTVNDEIRCVSPARYNNGEWTFPLIIAGMGNDRFLSVSYYCAKLTRIYKLERWVLFSQSFQPTQEYGRPHTIHFF